MILDQLQTLGETLVKTKIVKSSFKSIKTKIGLSKNLTMLLSKITLRNRLWILYSYQLLKNLSFRHQPTETTWLTQIKGMEWLRATIPSQTWRTKLTISVWKTKDQKIFKLIKSFQRLLKTKASLQLKKWISFQTK